MNMRLICQEGPGAGDTYALDPDKKTVYSMGRSSECDLVLKDHRSSRHHADIQWAGGQWQVIDRGSTNGTFVNGLQVHRPYDLRPGDRLTIGETTMVVSPAPAAEARPAAARPRPERAPAAQAGEVPAPEGRKSGRAVGFWLVQGLVTAAVVCLAAGAFLPWLEITGSLSRDLAPMVQGIADLIASLSGQDSLLHVSQRIGGLQGYGKLTLGIAIVSALALVVDVFFYRRSILPAIVYLGTAIVSIGAMGFDLANYYRYYQEMQNLSLLFGIQLGEVVQVFDHFIEMEATPMAGLFLTGAGLLLLLGGGIGRLVVALLERRERQ
ncbi:MAG: FHA domain-containing protein [Anaerolineae bacterium]